jgi:hypothetical protein
LFRHPDITERKIEEERIVAPGWTRVENALHRKAAQDSLPLELGQVKGVLMRWAMGASKNLGEPITPARISSTFYQWNSLGCVPKFFVTPLI